MNNFDDKELWDLLGKAPMRKAGPRFTQNVLQAISSEEQDFSIVQGNGTLISFSRIITTKRKSVAAACAACLTVACVIPLLNTNSNDSSLVDNATYELAELEETALALEEVSSPNSIVEVAYCYTDSLSDDELQYVIAML